MSVTESQFYMWRTLFALVHADDFVAPEELEFMREVLEDVDFSEEQKQILHADIVQPQSAVTMFQNVSESKDQDKLFHFAYNLMWVDGEFDENEQRLMNELQAEYDKMKEARGHQQGAAIEIAFEDIKTKKQTTIDKETEEHTVKDFLEIFKDYYKD